MVAMLGENRIRRKVGEAVARAVEPGETVRATVYLHTYGSATPAIVLGGLPVNLRTSIVALTDRRVLIFDGDETNASNSRLIAAYPRAAVSVDAENRPDRPTHLTLTFSDDGTRRFAVPNIWRKDAAAFVADLNSG